MASLWRCESSTGTCGGSREAERSPPDVTDSKGKGSSTARGMPEGEGGAESPDSLSAYGVLTGRRSGPR